MGHQYAGANAFPANFTIPDDGDADQAASFNVAYEALGDRTVFVNSRVATEEATRLALSKRLDRALALNFPAAVSASLAYHVKYGAAARKWYACGGLSGNDRFYRTSDPFSWPGVTELSGVAAHTLFTWDFAIDVAGQIVALAAYIDAYWTCTAGGVWTKRTSLFGNAPDYPAIVYESTSGLWCAATIKTAGGAVYVVTSPDMTTWTARTPPSGWPTANGTNITMAAGNGVIVMRATNDTNLYTSRSTDGGITWSATVTTALGFTAFYGMGGTREAAPVWTGTEWLIVVPNVSTHTAIYASADGLSWTLRGTLTTLAVSHFAHLAGVVVGCTSTQLIAFSQDAGATWAYGRGVANGLTGVSASPVQFVIAAAGTVYPGLALGDGLGAIT